MLSAATSVVRENSFDSCALVVALASADVKDADLDVAELGVSSLPYVDG